MPPKRKPRPQPKTNDWARFERAVDVVLAARPPRNSAKPARRRKG